MAAVPVLLLTGTVGVGKSTVAVEVHDVLGERGVPNVAFDLDAFTMQWPPSSKWNSDLMFESLAALWEINRHRGVERVVLAHVLEDGDERARYAEAIPGAELTAVRLVAPEVVRKDRLTARMAPGPGREWHLHRTVELDAILDAARHEDFVVDNGDRPVRDVALEVLRGAGWL